MTANTLDALKARQSAFARRTLDLADPVNRTSRWWRSDRDNFQACAAPSAAAKKAKN